MYAKVFTRRDEAVFGDAVGDYSECFCGGEVAEETLEGGDGEVVLWVCLPVDPGVSFWRFETEVVV